MQSIKALMIFSLILCTSMSFAAQRPYPDNDKMAPGSSRVGTPNYGADVTVKPGGGGSWSPDTNADGRVSASEAGEAGSRWLTRLQRKDYNGDGVLTRDEYWFP